MEYKIKNFPITMFAIVMGLSGFTIVLQKFAEHNWLPNWSYLSMLVTVSLIFVVIAVFYILKFIMFREAVLADFKHRIRINFFSTISISFLLLSVAFHPVSNSVSEILWWIGAILHAYLMLHTIRFWIQHNFEIHTFSPAWFIPVVGNIVIPVMGVEFLPVSISFFFFSVGAFFWIVLFTIFLNRVVFHDQMPQKFIPTLFILLAPPAVGFIAYYKITMQWDLLGIFLLNIAYFFAFLLVFLWKSFRNIKFFISWWAFIFPLDALTIASVLAYSISGQIAYLYASWVGIIVVVLFVSFVSYKTIEKLIVGEVCVEEE
jgi:tellurite resistance protein